MKRSKIRYRTVIISDVHLGLADCKIGQVNFFLRHIQCENLISLMMKSRSSREPVRLDANPHSSRKWGRPGSATG